MTMSRSGRLSEALPEFETCLSAEFDALLSKLIEYDGEDGTAVKGTRAFLANVHRPGSR
jgi:hypothetical protein